MERQTKDIYTLSLSTQNHQSKGKKQWTDLTESINFVSDKFKEYEESWVKEDKIIQDLKSEVDSMLTKVENLGNSKIGKNNTREKTVSQYMGSQKRKEK